MNNRLDLVGLGAALLGACGLGLAVALGRIAFEGGTNGLTLACLRGWLAVALMATICRAMGLPLRPPAGMLPTLVGLGLLMGFMNFGNVGSVAYIPVALAALLFFVFPPLVALLNAGIDRTAPGLVKGTALVGAFAGLAVMLGVELDRLDPRGVTMALGAGLACAVNIVWVGRRCRGIHTFVLVFHMSVVAAVSLSIAVLATGALALPTTRVGWLGTLAVMVLQSTGVPLFYIAVQRLGPEPTSMLSNLQPVSSIVAAWALFAEAMTSQRLAGAAMVIGGILLMQWDDRRRKGR